MSESKTLKDRNAPMLTAYVLMHVVVVGWLLLGRPTSLKALGDAGEAEWMKAAGTVVMGLLVSLLNRLGNSDLKAKLVSCRWQHPLPGSRAFSELAQRDQRVDVDRLKIAVGGQFPTDPDQQNRTWFRLFQQHADTESVTDGHRDYLLYRDTTWLSLLLCVAAPVTLWLVDRDRDVALGDLAACFVLLVLARTAAVVAGKRFVGTVLAVASSAVKESPPHIITP